MGRAQGIDPRRLFSTADPVIAGRDVAVGPTGRYSQQPQLPDLLAGSLSDADYLTLAEKLSYACPTSASSVAGMNFVVTSDTLWAPQSPKQKQYHGHIAIGTLADGTRQFAAVATYGPNTSPHGQAKVWERSTNLQRCLDVINDKLSGKQSGSGSSRYQRMNGSAAALYLDRAGFDRAFRERAGS